MRVLFIISDLMYNGAARQLTLLAKGLPATQFERRVCALGAVGPWADELREAGVIVDVLNWRWTLDLPALSRLRQALRAHQASVLHVWGQSALRAIALAGGLRCGRLFVTAPLPHKSSQQLGWADRLLLRRAERLTTAFAVEADQWRQLKLKPNRLIVIAPGVEAKAETRDGDERLPPRTIVCVGPLQRHKGFRDAIWVLDMLRFLHPGVQLAFVGDGPDRPAIERFAHDARVADRVRFLGDRSDVPDLLEQAELVWSPGRTAGGMNAVLEAMAARKPVIATRVPGMAELVIDGQTGFLVPPADPAALARQTRLLLDDADLRRRMGEAGRRRAAEEFAAAAMARRFAQLYDSASIPA